MSEYHMGKDIAHLQARIEMLEQIVFAKPNVQTTEDNQNGA